MKKTRTFLTREAAHPPYRALSERRSQLEQQAVGLRAEAARLRAATWGADPTVAAAARVEALIKSASADVPSQSSERSRLELVLAELRDVEDALAELSTRMRALQSAADRAVTSHFMEEHRDMLRAMWSGIAQAAGARVQIETLHRELRMAGYSLNGVAEKGENAFKEDVIDRGSKIALDLRDAARDGLIATTAVPELLR